MATNQRSSEKRTAPFARVLVVGAGFLGTHILQEFQTSYSNLELSALDNRDVGDQLKGVDYQVGDITKLDQLEQLLAKIKPDVIVHTASPPPASNTSATIMYKVNVEGTRNLLEAAESAGIRAFVFTSSAGVVYDGKPLINVDETVPTLAHHMDPYNGSKVEIPKLKFTNTAG